MSNISKRGMLLKMKETLNECKSELDHTWKQVSDWESCSHTVGYDPYAHPETSYETVVTYEEAVFECQNCGLRKYLRR